MPTVESDRREARQARARPARAPRHGACGRTPVCHHRYGRAKHDAYVLDVGALRQVRCAVPGISAFAAVTHLAASVVVVCESKSAVVNHLPDSFSSTIAMRRVA